MPIRLQPDISQISGWNQKHQTNEAFYKRLAPLNGLIEKLRSYYFGQIYGEYNFKASLIKDENIKFNVFASRTYP
jgi:hypothetical protein